MSAMQTYLDRVHPRWAGPWHVVRERDGVVASIESEATEIAAANVVAILNDHEARWGRPRIYFVRHESEGVQRAKSE